jgi:tRNA threonylcarbamoyladenosine biosynthesis protein TsaB
MALILSIETSTKICSVALHEQGNLMACSEVRLERSHAKNLIDIIQNVLSYSGHKMDDLQAIAVSKGPGSYTGLRIGVSSAKGFCYALDIPLIAVDTLEAMASGIINMNYTGALLCPMIDARRMEVYCKLMDNDLTNILPTSAIIIDDKSFDKFLQEYKILFFGDGAQKCKEVITHENAIFIKEVNPSAVFMGGIAYQKFQKQQFEDVAYLEPLYLKEFMMKLNK